jgi:hypothetical protein
MLAINHLINSLAKRPVEARPVHTLAQPTALFRQEACGYSDALDCHRIDAGVDVLVFYPIIDRREPIVAHLSLGFNAYIPGD